MQYLSSNDPAAVKAQHDPHIPWSLTGWIHYGHSSLGSNLLGIDESETVFFFLLLVYYGFLLNNYLGKIFSIKASGDPLENEYPAKLPILLFKLAIS